MRIAPDSVGKSFVGKSGPSNTGLSEVPDKGRIGQDRVCEIRVRNRCINLTPTLPSQISHSDGKRKELHALRWVLGVSRLWSCPFR
jgi:hypothetical protein